eukprot:1283409-Rhodomonas_salina.1
MLPCQLRPDSSIRCLLGLPADENSVYRCAGSTGKPDRQSVAGSRAEKRAGCGWSMKCIHLQIAVSLSQRLQWCVPASLRLERGQHLQHLREGLRALVGVLRPAGLSRRVHGARQSVATHASSAGTRLMSAGGSSASPSPPASSPLPLTEQTLQQLGQHAKEGQSALPTHSSTLHRNRQRRGERGSGEWRGGRGRPG